MAPTIKSRQLLVWTVPSIAILLSFLWYKRKRSGSQSDPGKQQQPTNTTITEEQTIEENTTEVVTPASSPEKIKRSLSGVESSPIDIPIQTPESKPAKFVPPPITDKDLDAQIEKIKSMKSPFSEGSTKKPRVRSALSLEIEKTKTPPKASPVKSYKTPEEIAVKTPSPMKKETRKQKVKKTIIQDMKSEESNETAASERPSSERDSANHSPADVMLASPSLSSISDNRSEGSSDSGKGCSDVATPAGDGSLSGDTPQDQVKIYEFIIPQQLVGRLIGRHGAVVQQIKTKTRANILIKRHPESTKMKLCAVEGTQKEIDQALKMIRQKFPEKRYPNVTLEQVQIVVPPPTCTLIPECIYLKLNEGINNDAIVSHIESPIHMFLQLHTHPSFPNLHKLQHLMNLNYNTKPTLPVIMLPKPPIVGTICAAPFNENWYRAQIMSTDEESDTSFVNFVDFGGYCNIENNALRQIRTDFITLPFQSCECVLANLRLKEEETDVTPEYSIQLIDNITRGYTIQVQVVGYVEGTNIPLVYVYIMLAPGNVLCLNKEIAEQGLAEWVEEQEV